MVKGDRQKEIIIQDKMSKGRKFLYYIAWMLLASFIYFAIVPLLEWIIPWHLRIGSGEYSVDMTGLVYFFLIMTCIGLFLRKWIWNI